MKRKSANLLLALSLSACSDLSEPQPAADAAPPETALDTQAGFQIDIWYGDDVKAANMATLRRALTTAKDRWEEILAPSDPWDVHSGNLACRLNGEWVSGVIPAGLIDDLAIIAMVEEVDGEGGTLAAAAPCVTRYRGFLEWPTPPMDFMPVLGIMIFDSADVVATTARELEDTVIHEMGHVLGLGVPGWTTMRLLHEPADFISPLYQDTYFSGKNAIRAFWDAGGDGYGGNIVPVENTGGMGTANGHWRESVMQGELMTGYASAGRDPISLVTLGALMDLGYAVDPSQADAYKLPDGALDADLGSIVPYGDDVLDVPLILVDREGSVRGAPESVK